MAAGLIVLVTLVAVPSRVLTLDWIFLVFAASTAAALLRRGRVGRFEGALLAGPGVFYAAVHLVR